MFTDRKTGFHAVSWKSRHQRPQRSRQGHHALLEPLESRTLLSALIQIVGGSTIIANGDTTPSAIDLTSFGVMSTTPSNAIGLVNRAFLIQNAGDQDLQLTGGTNPVRLSGTHAGDFVISAMPATAIPVGYQSGFTIAFMPKATGLRSALVTIPSNDPTQPSFTFTIEGTGVKTTNYANGLQVATLQAGTGLAATNGTDLEVNYTGYLLDGTIFDSSLNEGRSPFELTLGAGQVIQGWDQGLVGIKAGESRALFIPASLGYGSNAQGSIPANSPLIFTVQALELNPPALGITGKSQTIAFSDTTPSADDGTFLGATAPGSTDWLTSTFSITNAGGGSLAFPVSPIITLTGTHAAHFDVSQLTIDSSGTFATFTATFKPTKVGTFSAVVHVRTNDPAHPDYTFTIAATHTAFIDLAPAVGNIRAPATIVSGAGKKFTLPVTVTNLGNAAVPGSTPAVELKLYLRNIDTGEDILVGTSTTTNLRGTQPGKSKRVNLSLTIPITVPTGAYRAWVQVNESGALAEAQYANNAAISAQVLTVAQGYHNIDGTIAASTIPAALVSGVAVKGKVTVRVRNAGNLNLPSGQKVSVQVFAQDTTSGQSIALGAATVTTSKWAPGKSGNANVTVKLAGGLPAGEYRLIALLAPVSPLAETSTDDNLLLSDRFLSVAQGFHNIDGLITASTIPSAVAAGAAVKGRVTVKVRNVGNLSLPRSQAVSVQVFAQDTLSGESFALGAARMATSAWKPGKTGNASVTIKLAAGLPAANYRLIVLLTPVTILSESTTADNLITERGGVPILIAVA